MGESIPAALRPAEHRTERACGLCHQVDDHPHHIVWDPANQADRSAHLDCCAAAGCPDGSCNTILERADGKRGLDLAAHLQSGGAAHANYDTQEG